MDSEDISFNRYNNKMKVNRMKKLSLKLSAKVMLIAGVLVAVSSPVFAATVSSMINMGSQQNESGQTIDVVDVKCASASAEPRLIFSIEGERQWCSQDIPSICSRNKLAAAQRVCRPGFSSQIQEYKNSDLATTDISAPQANSTPPAAEVIESQAPIVDEQAAVDEVELEKQRILIEQERLQLRKQELELNKRRLELERQTTTGQ